MEAGDAHRLISRIVYVLYGHWECCARMGGRNSHFALPPQAEHAMLHALTFFETAYGMCDQRSVSLWLKISDIRFKQQQYRNAALNLEHAIKMQNVLHGNLAGKWRDAESLSTGRFHLSLASNPTRVSAANCITRKAMQGVYTIVRKEFCHRRATARCVKN